MGRNTIDTEMNRGFLQLLILFLLEKATYGYAILQRVNGSGDHPKTPSSHSTRSISTRSSAHKKYIVGIA